MVSSKTNRVASPEERYRLYVDESGDPNHRYLCLLGCFFQGTAYQEFHDALEIFKRRHVPHSPDEPVILHREDILNRRGSFWRLRDSVVAEKFNGELVELISAAGFRIIAVVIDKQYLLEAFSDSPSHPYHLGLGFMLQRYCGYLNHINRRGDVMAESRGRREDRKLKDSYDWVYKRGVWTVTPAEFFQRVLTSKELKVKPKKDNIAGLQVADLLGHPVKQAILREKRLLETQPTEFARQLMKAMEPKFNRHLYDDRVWGYGKVFYPRHKEEAPSGASSRSPFAGDPPPENRIVQ